MYTHVAGGLGTDFVANPTNPEAITVLARMEYRNPPPVVANIRIPLTWVLSVLAVVALVTGFTVPEGWWQDAGTNDLYGILGFLVLGVGAFGSWRGWVEDMYFDRITRPRFYQLRREGAIIKIPFRVSYYLGERLKALNLKDYATKSYQLQPADFDAMYEIAKADASGASGAKTWEITDEALSPLDRVMRKNIDRLLDEIAARIQQSYEDDASEKNGLLEGVRETPKELEGE